MTRPTQTILNGYSRIKSTLHFPASALNIVGSGGATAVTDAQHQNQVDGSSILPTYPRPSLMLTHGEGSYVADSSGKKYLDFTSGIAVVSLGHSDPEITKIISDQAGKLMHASMLFENEWADVLANKLVSTTKASGTMSDAHQVFLASSGTEANEAALKFARNFAKKSDPSGNKFEVVAFANAFHGRSMGSLSATYNPKYREPFAPLVPGFKHGVFNSTDGLDALITDRTCAVIVEPLQGEGGIYPAKPEFMAALRKRCDETKALLILDEVQSGIGRTGSFWAHAHPSLRNAENKVIAEPDILTSAKALGNGFPVGATIVTKRVAQTIGLGIHGTTYGGNPVACRVASHVIDRVSQKGFLQQVQAKSDHLVKGLKSFQEKMPNVIKEVRGHGLMLGIELQPDHSSKISDVIKTARDHGLLIIVAGPCIRMVPPLTIDEKDLDKGLEIFGAALEEVCG
ncbi:Acetylornithine aminotransferase [Fusarium austroafricanum]|uniref:acetylornithine transaminase n=1 Tax=Fusarium austroafricanum TaxID=2364996 RepID=A0A8H4KLN5_9HYPO|nr:Acetylornithine aminotransferase [Fusarium austroafricanum]